MERIKVKTRNRTSEGKHIFKECNLFMLTAYAVQPFSYSACCLSSAFITCLFIVLEANLTTGLGTTPENEFLFS